MRDICLYFQVHQPFRLHQYRLFDIGTGRDYFDNPKNRSILRRVADKCYLPANRLLERLVRETDGRFRFTLSMSGIVLEQLEQSTPDALVSFHDLIGTNAVELLGETYYHSLSALADIEEFQIQVELHTKALHDRFGVRPRVFRNTELVYCDALAPVIQEMGFLGVVVEGAGHILEWRSPNFVYHAAGVPSLRLMPRNFSLSDDIGFRFSNRDWDGWPVTADKYAGWLADCPGDSVHIFIDYETFGEHQWSDTGIFDFLRHLPAECERRGLRFVQPSDLIQRTPVGGLSFPHPTSWADIERDTTAWLGNRMQQAAQRRLYELREPVQRSGDAGLIDRWRRLTTSDHLYYMCTKWFTDGDVHKYFSPYETPYDAFIAFMNVLQDLEQSIPAEREGHLREVAWSGIADVASAAP